MEMPLRHSALSHLVPSILFLFLFLFFLLLLCLPLSLEPADVNSPVTRIRPDSGHNGDQGLNLNGRSKY